MAQRNRPQYQYPLRVKGKKVSHKSLQVVEHLYEGLVDDSSTKKYFFGLSLYQREKGNK